MNTILLTLAGSRAYGIHRPDSDVDMKGVCLASKPVYLGFLNNFAQLDDAKQVVAEFERLNQDPDLLKTANEHGAEGVIFEVKKFLKLACDANPNILDVLFCRDEDVIFRNDLGAFLRESAPMFVSAKAKHTFAGYARAQLKRIRGHRQWLLNPPTAPPTRVEYGLPERTLLPKHELGELNAVVRKKLDEWELDLDGLDPARRRHIMDNMETALTEIMATTDDKWVHAARTVGLDDNIIEIMAAERKYAEAKAYWKQYNTWKKSRNPARAELEAKYGFDTKHGSHLYRLLSMGREILTTGKVNVWRGDRDADVILGIRNGEWSYDQLVEWAERKDEEVNDLYHQMFKAKTMDAVIPAKPPRKNIDLLCQRIIFEHLRW